VFELGLHGWFTAFVCAVQLAYALLAFTHGGRSRDLSLPLGLLCLTVFGWNFADLAGEHSQQFDWRYLDVTLAPLTSAFTFHFVIGFVGELRRMRLVLKGVYLASIVLALTAGTSFSSDWGRAFIGSPTYTIWHMAIIAVVAVVSFALVYRHWRSHAVGLERLRTRLAITGGVFHTFVGTMELWWGFGIEMPRLASFGTLMSLSLWCVLTFRLNLIEKTVPLRTAAFTVLIAGIGVISYLIVLQAFSANAGTLVVGTFVIAIGAAVATSRLWVASTQERARLEKLAFLGRLADQMAHDLRNPLAVIMGAAQLLHAELQKKKKIDDPDNMIGEIIEQSQRINRMIDKYRRLGRIQIHPSPTNINQLLRQTVQITALSRRQAITLSTDLAPDVPNCSVDRDMMTVTLENLVRNSVEAMPDGGDFYVSSRPEGSGVLMILRDTGHGMNARTLDQCFEEMFSTKGSGSGLGLPFARQVMEGHGGSIQMSSTEQEGTEIRLWLPCAPPPTADAASDELTS